jgi:hypothetical protein
VLVCCSYNLSQFIFLPINLYYFATQIVLSLSFGCLVLDVTDVAEFMAVKAAKAAKAARAVRAVKAVRAVRAAKAARAAHQCRTILFRCLFGFPTVIVFIIPTVVFICVGHGF